MFTGLTPPGLAYFAGNYRGTSGLKCLEKYEVETNGDPMVGAPAENVAAEMKDLAEEVGAAIAKADQIDADESRPEDERILDVITLACDVFVRFLTIHPFANGNGHASRFVIWAFLARYKLFPEAWTIEPRPTHKHYGNGIYLYRRGSKERLLKAVLESLAPPSSPPTPA